MKHTISDVDECENDALCLEDSECQNLPGSYACSCKEGFVFEDGTDKCIGLFLLHN